MKFVLTILVLIGLTIVSQAQNVTVTDKSQNVSQNKKDSIEFVYEFQSKLFTLTNKSQFDIQLTINIVDLLTKQAASEQKADLVAGAHYSGYVADCYSDPGHNCHGLYYIQILDINGKQLMLKKVYAP